MTPGLVDKIKYAIHEAGIKFVSFTTNGILLNRNENYRRLIDVGVGAIYISTEGTDKETYEKVYGVKHYEEMLSGVHNLLEYNRSQGEPASIAIRFRNSQKPSESSAHRILFAPLSHTFRKRFVVTLRSNSTIGVV
ncbi:MAG: radical SAM protein [Limisphaerales bacterium]